MFFRQLTILFAIAATLLASAALAPSALAIETVIQDDAQFLHRSDDEVRASMQQVKSLGIDRVRLTAGWSTIAPDANSPQRPSFDDTDPGAYPPAGWARLDRAVRMAHEAGLEIDIDIAFWAPRWATQDPPAALSQLRNYIDPALYAHFSQAIARRYSGTFVPGVAGRPVAPSAPSPDGSLFDDFFGSEPVDVPAPSVAAAPLPAVSMFTIWNEPNHPGFIEPQWIQTPAGWVPSSPAIYRAMVQAAYPAIKAAAPGSRVLIGGTSSTGSSVPGRGGVAPLRFLRALACVDSQLQPIATGTCASFKPLPGDGWAHHPYSLRTTPDHMPVNPDNLPVAAIGRLTSTLRTLVSIGRISPAVADVYLTEYGYETNPPDTHAPFSPAEQPALLAWARYIATRDPAVKMWPQFLLRDLPMGSGPRSISSKGATTTRDWQSGLFYADGTPKPAAHGFGKPAATICRTGGARHWTKGWRKLRRSVGCRRRAAQRPSRRGHHHRR
jgi:hypothetical protein